MNFKTYPVDEMIRGENFVDATIEVGPKLPEGFLHCTLERCNVKVHAFTPSIRHSRLIDCTIECTKKMTDRRLPKFFSSDYVRCKFIGRFDGVDFGRDPRPYSGKPDEFGEFIDCDFTQSTLDLCRFFSVDITSQRFAPWPQFVIPSDRFAAAAQMDYAWPGELARFIRLARSENAAVSACTGTVADFTKRYSVTGQELEEALDVIGGVLR
jgi:hypothetical protein